MRAEPGSGRAGIQIRETAVNRPTESSSRTKGNQTEPRVIGFPITGKRYPAGMDDETLRFPAHIAEQLGLSANEIAWLRKKGCPFHGRKTSVRWVRLYLDKISGAEALIYGTEFPQCPLAKALSIKQ